MASSQGDNGKIAMGITTLALVRSALVSSPHIRSVFSDVSTLNRPWLTSWEIPEILDFRLSMLGTTGIEPVTS